MNNNRGNNRRRGRGNNNRQQGGQQTNWIDSRARGNAPQLLEKYKKLAHDAHLNGDRVQEEYYLQFADHYFRVIADQRQRQEELRGPRREERPYEYGYGYDNDGDSDYEPVADRAPRVERDSRPQPVEDDDATPADDGNRAQPDGNRSIYEPVENPFVREPRGGAPEKARNKPRRRDREERAADAPNSVAEAEQPQPSFDISSSLPPSISGKEEREEDAKPLRARPGRKPRAAAAPAGAEPVAPAAPVSAEVQPEEKPRARRRPRKAAASDGGGDSLETIG